jgi:hypothetical protein
MHVTGVSVETSRNQLTASNDDWTLEALAVKQVPVEDVRRWKHGCLTAEFSWLPQPGRRTGGGSGLRERAPRLEFSKRLGLRNLAKR